MKTDDWSYESAIHFNLGENMKEKIAKAAGEPGMFIVGVEEVFPKDYFLIPKNLPFLVGLILQHPESSTLGLSEEQMGEILLIKNNTVPEVLKISRRTKKLELELGQNIAIDDNTPESQYGLVDEIGKLRTELTKEHLRCIRSVRAVLTKEQYEKLLNYATRKGQ